MANRKPVFHFVASTQRLWTFDNDGRELWRPATPSEQADYAANRRYG